MAKKKNKGNKRVRVDLGKFSYNIYIGPKKHKLLSKILKKIKGVSSIAIITNPTVFDLYGKKIQEEVELTGLNYNFITVPDGEGYKNVLEAEKVLNKLIDLDMDRSGFILALGGGVIGDLTGFIAATYQRGVPFAQIPTTLLSSVDASVGGKVAVNLSKGKNMMGLFYQPSFVITDVDFLQSLSERDYLSGLAEVLKHGLIGDKKLLKKLFKNVELVRNRDEKMLEIMIQRSVEYKKAIVIKDEKEKNLRQVLNFGHTIGHAIESLKNYQGITHGEAVSIGIVSALLLSNSLYGFPMKYIEKTVDFMKSLKLPVWQEGLSIDGIIEHLKYDKKRRKSETHFVLLKEIGSPVYGVSIPGEKLKEILNLQKERFLAG